MEFRVLGCHGGETPRHRTSSFLLDGVLGIDAGATTAALTLPQQRKLQAVLVSHAHMDHVKDLATLADNRCQMGGRPLVIAGTPWTIGALRKHFFNNVLWPDFSKIPLSTGGGGMTIEFLPMKPERTYDVAGFQARAVLVSHTIESAAFIVEKKGRAIAYSGDTGPTDRLWELLSPMESLGALVMEVSFPDEMAWLAKASGHHTPKTLDAELGKLKGRARGEVPVLLYHIKPHFQREVEKQLAKLKRREFDVLSLDDELII